MVSNLNHTIYFSFSHFRLLSDRVVNIN